jgi:hypothetical protein
MNTLEKKKPGMQLILTIIPFYISTHSYSEFGRVYIIEEKFVKKTKTKQTNKKKSHQTNNPPPPTKQTKQKQYKQNKNKQTNKQKQKKNIKELRLSAPTDSLQDHKIALTCGQSAGNCGFYTYVGVLTKCCDRTLKSIHGGLRLHF